ncbi:MAG: hypothetical protein K0U86_22295 [Planctomycetes bacterium]|nr:hypothetical protein [Planctomycetota bacterium]MCH9727640.1 hypothetical protein [Planctomycetota bacterium]MCH9777380.1 hypothetical protein [Planctomycetota bacterium]
MNIGRGIIAGLIGAVLGVVVPVLVIGLYTLLYWHFNETYDMDRRADIANWKRDAVSPLVGCAIYVGLADLIPVNSTSDYERIHPGRSPERIF